MRAAHADQADRILRVLNYIQTHLDDDLSPADLAGVACFSLHHFHRTFSGMIGESVMAHVRRLRLERAAWRLVHSQVSVTEVALEANYENLESFTRAFGQLYGRSPSGYRSARRPAVQPHVPSGVHFQPDGRITGFRRPTLGEATMEIRRLPRRRVAFVRHVGPYSQCGAAWDRLCGWAAANGLIRPGATMLGLCHDDPEITPADEIRYDACLTVDDDVEAEDGVAIHDIPAGDYAVVRHRGPYERLSETYAELFGRLIPASGREPAPAPCVEQYWNDPGSTPAEELDTDVLVLLEPTRR